MTLPGFEDVPGLTERAWAARQALILGLLHHRSKKPVVSRVIEPALGITGPEVRALVSQLRLLRLPIGSGSKGYFWASDICDIEETILHLQSRARRCLAVARTIMIAKFGMTKIEDVMDHLETQNSVENQTNMEL